MLTVIDVWSAVVYVVGYLLVAAGSFLDGKHHCWAYTMLAVAAFSHLTVLVVRCKKRRKKGRHSQQEESH